MGIDFDKMKAKRDALENRGNGKSVFWRPEDGEQTIRLLPTADGDPFKQYWFHYNLGKNAGFLSPKKNFGEDDPLDSFIRQLYKDGSDDSVRMAKDLSARQRFFSPVLVRGEEGEGVRLWGYGKMAYKELLNLVLNPEYGDITDSVEGTDITLTYTKPTRPGAYPQTNLKMRRNTSPLLGDADAIPGLLENMPDFDSLFERLTPEQVDAILDEQLASDKSAEGRSSETHSYGKKEANDVDKAFDELMAG